MSRWVDEQLIHTSTEQLFLPAYTSFEYRSEHEIKGFMLRFIPFAYTDREEYAQALHVRLTHILHPKR
jgi:hypothetical protein